jgi:hypothetical protein
MLGFLKKKQPRTSGEWSEMIARLEGERLELERQIKAEIAKREQLDLGAVDISLDHQGVLERDHAKVFALIAHATNQLKRAEAAERQEQDRGRQIRLRQRWDEQHEMARRIDELLETLRIEAVRFEEGRSSIIALGGLPPRRTRLLFTVALKKSLRDFLDLSTSVPGSSMQEQVAGLGGAQSKEAAA